MIRGHEIRIVQKNAYTIVIPTGNTKSKQKTNKYAVCLYCVEECAQNIVVVFYNDHLANCENFKNMI